MSDKTQSHPLVLSCFKGAKIAAVCAILNLCCSILFAQQTESYELRAIPVPAGKEIKVDGVLDEWDLSGEVLMCYDLGTLINTNSVWVASMYDRKGIYLSFRFKDATPMVNHVDPLKQPGEGWRSDCVQLRFWADSDQTSGSERDRVSHIDCYWFTDGNKPAARWVVNDIEKGKEGFESSVDDAIGRGIEAGFCKDPDGKGYTQEMFISWDVLRRNGKALGPNEGLRLGIEALWGDFTGAKFPSHRYADLINKEFPQREFFWAKKGAWGNLKMMDHGSLEPSPSVAAVNDVARFARIKYATEGSVPISYTLSTDSLVTLVVERPDGSRVRNLISDYPRKKGLNQDYWDGADDSGQLVQPGEYLVRGLYHEPFDLLYQFSYGSPGNPPWQVASGRGGWLSDHERPVSMASDGNWIYAAGHMSEAGETVIGMDANGQKQWGIGRMSGGMLAFHKGSLYMVTGGGQSRRVLDRIARELHLIRIDAREGKLKAFSDGKSDHLIAQTPIRQELSRKESEGALIQRNGLNAEWLMLEGLGLASANGKLYISVFNDNKVLVVDPETGLASGEISVPHPAGLASDANGILYVASEREILKLDADGKFVSIVSSGLDAPVGLTTDAKGNLYVSDWGTAMCVKVFSLSGRLLRTVGTKGGRPLEGKYNPNGMFLPWGMAVDKTGRLWVAEYDYSPKRISVWSENGKFEKEYCGPTWYGSTECNVNQLDPTKAFSAGNILGLDWKSGLWRVDATLWRSTKPDALFGPFGESLNFKVVDFEGRRLLIANRGYYVCISELQKDRAKPLMALGGRLEAFVLGQSSLDPFPEIAAKKIWDDPEDLKWAKEKYPVVFRGNEVARAGAIYQMVQASAQRGHPAREQFIWIDQNGDGLVQEQELRLFRPDEVGGLSFQNNQWNVPVGPNLSIYGVENAKGTTRVWRLPFQGFNECGAPNYRPEDAKLFFENKPQVIPCSSWMDSQGSLLLNQAPLTMVGKNGEIRWTYPNRWPGVHGSHSAPKDKNGLLIGTLKVLGSATLKNEIGDVFCLSGNMGKAYLMTQDGLYIGSFFRDYRSAPDALPEVPRRGMSINSTCPMAEWFGGEFFQNPQDGKIYLGSTGHDAVLISEVAGLDSIRRLPTQTIQFTEKDRTESEKLMERKKSAASESKYLTVTKWTKKSALPPAVEDFAWGEKESAHWRFDESRAAEASWSFDHNYLYLCFRNVDDSSPMINGGKIVQQLFKTGDAVAFELRTEPDNNDPNVIPGDFRLILSTFQDKPVAVLYRYRVPGVSNPVTLSSPVINTRIDSVEVLGKAHVAIDRKGTSYTVRAAIPLAELGFNPTPGHSYRGDFGVIHSDKTGLLNELRMYWSNQATGVVSDLAVEAAIEPKWWGVFSIKNP